MRNRLLLIGTCFFVVLCSIAQQQPLFTRLASKQTGIDFNNIIRENEALNVLAYEYFYNGGGIAAGDINNDGLPDLFFTANLRPNKLYLNKGNFQFTDITKAAKVSGRKDWKTGVTMADVNGDGWLDIYVSYSGKGSAASRRNELYINNRDGSFAEKAWEYGLADEGCTTQAVFFDYDLDGDLDCYVLNHNIRAFKNIELQHLKSDYDTLAADRLYRNDDNRFTDISRQAGISGNPISFGLGVAVSDINNDGWPDIYVSNDYTEQDYCYINNRKGGFVSREHYMFSHQSQFSMGSDIADMNNDGMVDIITLDMLPPDNRRQKLLQAQENYELYQDMASNGFHYQFMRNMLQLNNGNGTFSEVGQLAGISNTDWSWAPLMADLDNDGHKDLFVTTGYLRDYTNKDFLKYWGDYLVKQVVKRDSINYMDIIKMMPVTILPNYVFKNSGALQFIDQSSVWGLNQPGLSHGATYADLDRDGDLDLVINNMNEEAGVYRNETSGQHFLQVQLKGNRKNRFGLGAKLYCYAGGKQQFIEQMPTRGYQSSVSEILHFGLGDKVMVDSLKVIWPDGLTEIVYAVNAGQRVVLEEKNARPYVQPFRGTGKKLFSFQKAAIDYTHLQLEYNDFKRQPLMPVMLSACGPRFLAADVDADGNEDIFIGSSQGQSSVLYLQQAGGKFLQQNNSDFLADSLATTTDLVFFDADQDGDQDIYAVSGGYADYQPNDKRLQDRLFLNDGKGSFHLSANALPVMTGSKSCVAAADIDGDSDLDLFVGGRVRPGAYPQMAASYLLLNDGRGRFTDVAESWLPGLSKPGRITDGAWIDLNKDQRPDLVLAGEWMSPRVMINNGSSLQPHDAGLNEYKGWWNVFEFFDMDRDGDMDLVAGNWGLNSQLQASKNEPVTMIWKDFDQNGSIDPFLCYYINGVSYPYVSRDELLDQIYPLRKKFTSYKNYADATMADIFTAEELKDAEKVEATHLATTLFENDNGIFIPRSLPVQAQFSPVYKIVVEDWNHDGHQDLLLLGNNEYTRLKMGKMDANFGTTLINDGKGNFRYVGYEETGLLVAGDVKDAMLINAGSKRHLLIGINNAGWLDYIINQ